MNSRILPSLALLLSLGIFFVYVNPTWNDSILATQERIAQADQTLAAATKYTKQQKELTDARNAIDPANLTRLTTFLPDSVNNVGLVLDLNALAARSGLSLSNIDVVAGNVSTSAQGALSVGSANPLGSVNLSLSAAGTYAALQAFLTGIEKSARILDVKDIVVRGSDTGVYTYQMKIRLYWLR